MSCNKLHSRRRLYYLSRMVARLKILFLLGLALLLAAPAPASIPRDVFQPLRETSASGNLTRYIHNGDTCHLVRDWADPLKRPLMEVKLDGSPTCAWIWANDLLIAQVDDIGTIHYAHTDELGNLIALSDSAGNVTDQFACDPYGQLIARTGTTDIPFTWLADYGVVDLGENLYITLHRPYHAGLARFLSKDPIGLQGGLNLYAYGDLNPLFYVDYLGLCTPNSLNLWTRVAGAGQMVGGAVEAAAGYTFGTATSPTLLGGLAGATVGTHGLDNVQAGFRQMVSGQNVDTHTSQSIQSLGVSKNTANLVDAGMSIAFTAGAGALNNVSKASTTFSLSDDMTTVSRWGREGLQPGDFVMNGGATKYNYAMSGKWQPGAGNTMASFSSGQEFTVPASTLGAPSQAATAGAFDKGVFGWVKYGLGQRSYNP